MNSIVEDEKLDALFLALADPTRRAIVRRLSEGDVTLSELGDQFPITLPAIAKHLRILERAGLLVRGRDAQRRPCTLRGESLGDAVEWLDRYRTFWSESFDRLDDHLRDLQNGADR